MAETYTSQEAFITRKAKENGIPEEELNAYFNSSLDEVSLKNPTTSVDWRLGRTEYLTWEHFFPGESFPGRMEVLSTATRTATARVAKKETSPTTVKAEPAEPRSSPVPRAPRVPPSLSMHKEASSRDWIHDKYEAPRTDLYRPQPPREKSRIDSYRPQSSKENQSAARSLPISGKPSGTVLKKEGTAGQDEKCALKPLPNGSASHLEHHSNANRSSLISFNGNNPGQPYHSQYHTMEAKAKGLGIPLHQVEKCFEEKATIAEDKFADRAKGWQMFFAEASVWGRFFKEWGPFPGVEPPKYSKEHCGSSSTVKKKLPGVSDPQPNTILSASNMQNKGDDSEPTVILPGKSQHVDLVKRELSETSDQLQSAKDFPAALTQAQDPPSRVASSARTRKDLPNSNVAVFATSGLERYVPNHSEGLMKKKAVELGIRSEFFKYLEKMRVYAKDQHRCCSSLYLKNWFADNLTWSKFFIGSYPFQQPQVIANGCQACLKLPCLAPVPATAVSGWVPPPRWSGPRAPLPPQLSTSSHIKTESASIEVSTAMTKGAENGFILSIPDEHCLVGHFGASFKDKVVKLYKQILANPRAQPATFGVLISNHIPQSYRPSRISQDIQRIFGSRLSSEYDGKNYYMKVFPSKKSQSGKGTSEPEVSFQKAVNSLSDQPRTIPESSQQGPENGFALPFGEERILINYFGTTGKDAIVGFYKKLVSMPGPLSECCLVSFGPQEKNLFSRMESDMRRIFDSRLKTRYNSATAKLLIHDSSSAAYGMTSAHTASKDSKIPLPLPEALSERPNKVSKNNIKISSTANKLQQSGKNSRSQDPGTQNAGTQPANVVSQQVASSLAPVRAPNTSAIPSALGTPPLLKDQATPKTPSFLAKSLSRPPPVVDSHLQPPVHNAPQVESHPSSPPPNHLLPTLAQMWQRDPYLGRGTVVMQNTCATIANKIFVGALYNCFLSDSKESIATVEKELKCHINYHLISTGDFFLWTESYVPGDDNAFNCGHMFLQGWVERNMKFGIFKLSDHWNAIQTPTAPIPGGKFRSTNTANSRSFPDAEGNVRALGADPALLMTTARHAIQENITPSNPSTVAIDAKGSVGSSAIIKPELSFGDEIGIVSKDTRLPSTFENPESLWQKYNATFCSSEIDRLLTEEKAKTEGNLRMVVDKESGQIVNVEELIKRTIYRCSVAARQTNEISPTASKTSGGRSVLAALRNAPGLAEAGASRKKRKVEDGNDAENAHNEKRTCL